MDFPGFDPVALHLGPLVIRWYALAYLSGFLLAWRYAIYLAGLSPGTRPDRNDADDLLPWTIVGVILGGRLGYILFYNPAFYLEKPAEILKVWHGGMSFHGAVIGVIAALLIFSYRRKISPRRVADIICAGVPIGLFFGRLANFVNGELYGRVTDVPWAVKFPAGDYLPRHPSQIYEAILEGLVLFVVLYILAHREKIRETPGIVTGVFLIGYGLFRMFVEMFREPDAQLGFIISEVSMGQILCVPMIILGACVVGYALHKKQE